jgi:hypothetical protein
MFQEINKKVILAKGVIGEDAVLTEGTLDGVKLAEGALEDDETHNSIEGHSTKIGLASVALLILDFFLCKHQPIHKKPISTLSKSKEEGKLT